MNDKKFYESQGAYQNRLERERHKIEESNIKQQAFENAHAAENLKQQKLKEARNKAEKEKIKKIEAENIAQERRDAEVAKREEEKERKRNAYSNIDNNKSLVERDNFYYEVNSKVPFTGVGINARKVSKFQNGKLNGIRMSYYDTDKLKLYEKCNFKNGKAEGLYKSHHENGKLSVEANKKDDKWDGLYKTYHKNGNLKFKGNYKSNWPSGIQEQYHENGEKAVSKIFKFKNANEGSLCTFHSTYKENGHNQTESRFDDHGRKHGVQISYDDQRNRYKTHMDDGVRLKEWKNDEEIYNREESLKNEKAKNEAEKERRKLQQKKDKDKAEFNFFLAVAAFAILIFLIFTFPDFFFLVGILILAIFLSMLFQ